MPPQKTGSAGAFAAIACAVFVATTQPAFASPWTEPAITVSARDLDLSTTDGARILLGRLERAAARVCNEGLAQRYPAARRHYRTCYQSTLHQAVASVEAPLVREQYVRRTGGAVQAS